MADFDYARALEELAAAGAEFIVVEGVSAVLNGAPVYTFDLDVVYKRSRKNIENLLLILHTWMRYFVFSPNVSFAQVQVTWKGRDI